MHCLHLMYVSIYIVKSMQLNGHLLGNSCYSANDMSSFCYSVVPECQFIFFPNIVFEVRISF